MSVEPPLDVEGICIVLGWSRSKFYNHKDELLKDGAIFHNIQGSPPRRRKIMRAHESTLKDWVRKKTLKGEAI